MAPVYVDAGYLIAISDTTDQHHEAASEWIDLLKATRTPVVTTEFCLIEVVDHHSDKATRGSGRETVRLLQNLPDAEVVPASSSLIERGLQFHRRRDDKTWSLTDCISLVVMRDRGIQRVLGFDSDFDQAGKRMLCGT